MDSYVMAALFALVAWIVFTILAVRRQSPLLMWAGALALTILLGLVFIPLFILSMVQWIIGLVWFFTIDWDARFPSTPQQPAEPAACAGGGPHDDPEVLRWG